jgi:hypothetical protein
MSNDTLRIEIVFPFKVDVPERASSLIHEAVSLICEKNCPEDSVMWPSGHGQKPTYIPMTQYEEQFRGMEFDDTVEYFEVSCRTAYPQELERKARKKAESANPSTNTHFMQIAGLQAAIAWIKSHPQEGVLNTAIDEINAVIAQLQKM